MGTVISGYIQTHMVAIFSLIFLVVIIKYALTNKEDIRDALDRF